jgi:hypothetical protein
MAMLHCWCADDGAMNAAPSKRRIHHHAIACVLPRPGGIDGCYAARWGMVVIARRKVILGFQSRQVKQCHSRPNQR